MENFAERAASREAPGSQVSELLAVLGELFELLEDYAPAWYTEAHHNRAAAALGEDLVQSAWSEPALT